MEILRYSAAENQGIPIINLADLKVPGKVAALMREHSVTPAEISVGLVDITPSCMDTPTRYFLSRSSADSPVVVEVMETDAAQIAPGLLVSPEGEVESAKPNPSTTVVIPHDSPAFIIGDRGFGIPRIHEFIVAEDAI